MINIQFPKHPFKIKQEKEKEIIFDECRKQWVHLTPEEWVRQNFLQYLMQEKKVPCPLIAVEKEISLSDVKKRFDIVVYKDAKPWLIVECKEMQVPLTEAVIKQVLNYNIALQLEYMVVTNGTSTFCVRLQAGSYEWLDAIPSY